MDRLFASESCGCTKETLVELDHTSFKGINGPIGPIVQVIGHVSIWIVNLQLKSCGCTKETLVELDHTLFKGIDGPIGPIVQVIRHVSIWIVYLHLSHVDVQRRHWLSLITLHSKVSMGQ